MSIPAALVAGTLGLIAGLALERMRRSSTDRRWLLDRRHESYVEFLQRAHLFSNSMGDPGEPGTDNHPMKRANELQASLYSLDLVASEDVYLLAHNLGGVVFQRFADGPIETREELRDYINQTEVWRALLTEAGRREVLPQPLRPPWRRKPEGIRAELSPAIVWNEPPAGATEGERRP